jgi:predicted RNase H-like HicB family nuclease
MLMSEAVILKFPVGLEEAPDGATFAHSLTVPGCVARGPTRDDALAAFPRVLSQWLRALGAMGEPVPAADAELEIAVDEWITTDADVAAGESNVCFEADLRPLTEAEVLSGMQRLGDLRGMLLARIRRMPDAELDGFRSGSWTLRQTLDELARAQWWTLSRLGASPLAEVPDRTLARLDTAMALVVQHFGHLTPEMREQVIELEGEVWTPRKVLRRLLWLEWSLGRAARHALTATP